MIKDLLVFIFRALKLKVGKYRVMIADVFKRLSVHDKEFVRSRVSLKEDMIL